MFLADDRHGARCTLGARSWTTVVIRVDAAYSDEMLGVWVMAGHPF